ncbi:MAG: MOSC domain-containing protein [Methylocella sp.]
MPAVSGLIVSVQVGGVAPLGPKGVPSGFIKRPVDEPVMAGRFGLAGDEQADRRVHGGPAKAVYCYPVEHYRSWRTTMPQHAALLVPGGFGENLTTEGFDEDNVAIGDIFRIGRATAQVTQPRQPCFKLALRFEDPQMGRAMVRLGFSGWYLRILEPGLIGAGAPITLVDRPNPAWSITRFNQLIKKGAGALEESAELADLRGLAHSWRKVARASLTAASKHHARFSPAEASGPPPPDDSSLRHSSSS